jgi:cobalt-zinc-cadmium efflux system membrane fusion protein
MRRNLLYVVVALVAASALGGIFYLGRATVPVASEQHAEAAPKPPDGQVKLTPEAQRNIGLAVSAAVQRPIERRLSATGTIAADQGRLVRLRALGRGRVLDAPVHAGDPIRKGQLLITYDDLSLMDLRTRQASVQAALAQANTTATATRAAYVRSRALAGETISVGEVERRRAVAAQATAEVATQRAQTENIQRQIAEFGANTPDGRGTTIAAPFDGFAIVANVAPGDMLDVGQEVMDVADLSSVWLLVNVYQDDVQQVRQGGTAMIHVTGLGGAVFAGIVTNVGHALDPRTAAVQVRCTIDNPGQLLRIGMFATADLPTRGERQALVVPASAIQKIDDKPVVFVQTADDVFMRHNVETGIETPEFVEIKQGIDPGARVVVHGSFELKSEILRQQLGSGG